MVHKNLNRPETSLTPFDLLNKNRVYYNIKRQGTTSMVIPCLCLFIALSSLFSELVGAKPLHLLTQTVLLLKHPTGAFVASQTRFCWGVPAPNPTS